MQIKDLRLKKVWRSVLLVLLLNVAGMGKIYAEVIGDLVYSLNKNTLTATVIRHVNSQPDIGANYATGILTIPSSVIYTHEEQINGHTEYVTRTYTVTTIGGYYYYDSYWNLNWKGAFEGCSGLIGICFFNIWHCLLICYRLMFKKNVPLYR